MRPKLLRPKGSRKPAVFTCRELAFGKRKFVGLAGKAMEFLILVFALPALVWAGIALWKGSTFLSAAIFLVVTSCFPAEFFAVDAVGLTWTLDRLWFLIILAQASLTWYRGGSLVKRMELTDIALIGFLGWMFLRTITQPLGSVIPGQPATLMHFINGYAIPFGLYAILRTTRPTKDQLIPPFWLLIGFGVYLSLIALLEVGQVWALVFPSFISDPDLGIHFGRARGPMLQSVRLGMCLIIVWVILSIFTIWLKPTCRFRWALFGSLSLLMVAAIFFTYTRSVWLGLALAIIALIGFGMSGKQRQLALFCIFSGGLFVGAVKGPDLVAFKREYSAAETQESTYMRAAFAYVSWEMFKDRPLAGHGFNQFQVHNPPYLTDRSTSLRLESIRGYVHHNGFLSLLVDLGIVGFAAYIFFLLTFFFQALALWKAQAAPKWARGCALASIAYLGVHSIQMAFHELSFSSIENGFLLACCGVVVSAGQEYCVRERPEKSTSRTNQGWGAALGRFTPGMLRKQSIS